MVRFSDGPKLSVTRVCADDLGSALTSLLSLKHQAPIVDFAARCDGLHLKPSKCVLIVTVFKLSEWLIQSIRSWPSITNPQFADIDISDSGKLIGWHLGRQAAVVSFAAPH